MCDQGIIYGKALKSRQKFRSGITMWIEKHFFYRHNKGKKNNEQLERQSCRKYSRYLPGGPSFSPLLLFLE